MAETRNLPKEWWDSWWNKDTVETEKVEERPTGFTDISNKIKEFIELPDEQRTKKDFYSYLGDLNKYKGMAPLTSSREKLLAEFDTQFKDRRKDDLFTGPRRHSGTAAEEAIENKEAITAGLLTKTQAEQAIRDKELEEEAAFRDTPRGRMQTMWNDADKRDAILGGIADAMLETRTGVDAYGNRFARAQRNVRDNLKIAEATDIARQKAQLDAMKTMAETNKLVDPRQYMTDAQAEASSIIRAQIRAGKIKAEDYDTAYASMLKQIAVKDLTSAKASSISTLFTYAKALQSTDPVTAGILMDAIKSNAMYLAGDGASGEVITETIDATTL